MGQPRQPSLRQVERELEQIDFEEMTALHLLVAIYRKQEAIMADLQKLQDAVNQLGDVEHAVAGKLQELIADIGNLTAGTITQEQIDALADKVISASDALTNDVAAAELPTDADKPASPSGDGVDHPLPDASAAQATTGTDEPLPDPSYPVDAGQDAPAEGDVPAGEPDLTDPNGTSDVNPAPETPATDAPPVEQPASAGGDEEPWPGERPSS